MTGCNRWEDEHREREPDVVAISQGQRWKPKGESVDWRVVSLHVDTVGLSGPGLCRSMTYVALDDLLAGWELLPDDAWKKKMDARRAAATGGAGSSSASRRRRSSASR